jgi:hypothetical protein
MGGRSSTGFDCAHDESEYEAERCAKTVTDQHFLHRDDDVPIDFAADEKLIKALGLASAG